MSTESVVAEVAPQGRSNQAGEEGREQEQATNDARQAGNARDALPHPTWNATLF